MNNTPIVSALITPFTPDNTVNHEALRAIVEHAIGLGVAGFYVCGTTGEGFQMTVAERQAVVETVCGVVAKRCQVMVNISHMDFRDACALADHAHDMGADMVSALPPIYNAISHEDLLRYVSDLMDSARLPFALYHVPLLSGRTLDANDIARLAQHERFVGMKYTSEDTVLLGRIKQIDSGRLTIWSGRDAYFLGNLAMGADGAVGSTFQLMGDLFNAVAGAYRAGDVALARKIQMRINAVHKMFNTHGFLQSYKACFELMGIPAGICRKPYNPLPVDTDAHMRKTLELLTLARSEHGQDIARFKTGHAVKV